MMASNVKRWLTNFSGVSLPWATSFPEERIDRKPQPDGNPSRDRRLTVPTRPPGEQTSVSVRNATGVRSNAYAVKSRGGKAKAIAPCAQHTLKRELCIHQPPPAPRAGMRAVAPRGVP